MSGGRSVARRYASKDPSGGIKRCGPRPDELRTERLGSSQTKVIYPDPTAARMAANELERLDMETYMVYPCRRGPHYHIAHAD